MAEDFQIDLSSRYSSTLSLSYSSSSFNMTESSDPASCVESDLEKGSENIVVPYQYEPRKVALSQNHHMTSLRMTRGY